MIKYWKNRSPPNKIIGSRVLEQSIRKEKGTKNPTYQAQWDPRQISPSPELSCYSCKESTDGHTPFPHCCPCRKSLTHSWCNSRVLTHKTEVIPRGEGMGFEHKERAASERGCLKVNWDVSGRRVMLRSSQPEQATGRSRGSGPYRAVKSEPNSTNTSTAGARCCSADLWSYSTSPLETRS